MIISKNDYNFQLLLVVLVVVIVLMALGSIGALIMFLSAFM